MAGRYLGRKFPYSQEQIEKAFWHFEYRHFSLDPLVKAVAECDAPLKDELLKVARNSRQLSMEMVAKRLKMSVQSYWELEQSAKKERISIAQLRKAADALDCDVICFLRPKSRKTFAREVWEKLLPFGLEGPGVVGRKPMPTVLAHVMRNECMADPAIRRRLGWARKDYVKWPRYFRWDQKGKGWPYDVVLHEKKPEPVEAALAIPSSGSTDAAGSHKLLL